MPCMFVWGLRGSNKARIAFTIRNPRCIGIFHHATVRKSFAFALKLAADGRVFAGASVGVSLARNYEERS
jgi:hypothetical protein